MNWRRAARIAGIGLATAAGLFLVLRIFQLRIWDHDIDFARVAPGRWLLDHVPWTEGDYRITAIAAGERAALLETEAVAPCLSFERWTSRGGTTLTYVRQIFPSGFALTAGG